MLTSLCPSNLIVPEVDVLDPEPQTLHQAQSAAIEKFDHEPSGAGELGQDCARFFAGEDHRDVLRCLGALDILNQADLLPEHVLVEEQQGAERLILRGSTDLALDRQMRQEIPDMSGGQIFGMAFAVKANVALDPIGVRLLRADAVMFEPANVTNLVKEFGLAGVGTGRYDAVHEAVAYQT